MKLAPRAIILAVVLSCGLAGCASTPEPANSSGITSVLYSQSQAIENFDNSEYVQEDAAELDRLQNLLDEYDVVPGVTDNSPKEQCDGGRSTSATITYGDSSTAELVVESCGESDFSDFNNEADDLFSQWRESAQ